MKNKNYSVIDIEGEMHEEKSFVDQFNNFAFYIFVEIKCKLCFTILECYDILAKSLNKGIRESSDGQLCFWRRKIRRKSYANKERDH